MKVESFCICSVLCGYRYAQVGTVPLQFPSLHFSKNVSIHRQLVTAISDSTELDASPDLMEEHSRLQERSFSIEPYNEGRPSLG